MIKSVQTVLLFGFSLAYSQRQRTKGPLPTLDQVWETAKQEMFNLETPIQSPAAKANFGELTCDQAVNQIIFDLPSKGSIFYLIVNGAYLGQMGDFASCYTDAVDGQYMLASLTGDYVGDYAFPRGTFGKYTPFTTQMGLCVPKQCSVEQVSAAFEPLMTQYAANAGWTNTKVELQATGYYTREVARSLNTEKAVFLGFFGLLLLVVVSATVVQTSKFGDKADSQH